jgi:putative ABC transport system substrate-binding protein
LDCGIPIAIANNSCGHESKFFWLITAILFVYVPSAEAQQPVKIPRIGFLFVSSLSANSARADAFRQGLRDLGYVEGKNIMIDWRSADGKPDRVPGIASELVHLDLDVIVTAGPAATGPTKEATATIPIVMAQDSDPVGNGFVASLARPERNITGLSAEAPEK